MTARKPPAHDRIEAAHEALLTSVRITPGMPEPVRNALVRRAEFIESCVLASLVGRLAGRVSNGKPLSPTALAEIVEDVCGMGVNDAGRLIAVATPKETGQ